MRIALSLEHFDPALGGQAIWTRGFASWLLDAGHEVHVVACGFGAHGLQVRTHAVPWSRSPLARARRFADVLRAVNADVVHDAGAAVAEGLWQPHTGSDLHSLDRLIATEPWPRRTRAALSPKMHLLRMRMDVLEKAQARRAARIVAVSPLVAGLLAARHPRAAHKIVTVMNGVDTGVFSPEALTPMRAGARRALGVGEETFLFLTAAHNPRLKGLDITLRALAALCRGGANAHLALAGGAEETEWRALARALGVEERLSFLGLLADMRPVYAAAVALAHPTRWDACSLVVLEALSAGLPVITTRANGAAAAICDGESGLLLENPEDVTGLTRLMRSLLKPDTRARLSEGGRAAALAHDIRVNYAAVERLLSERAAAR